MTELEALCATAHQTAKDHGWWDHPPEFGTLIALCQSELSEALQEYRNGHAVNETYGADKPEGVPIELADCIIRILDLCGQYGINMDAAIRTKMGYNVTRPYRHGNKVI